MNAEKFKIKYPDLYQKLKNASIIKCAEYELYLHVNLDELIIDDHFTNNNVLLFYPDKKVYSDDKLTNQNGDFFGILLRRGNNIFEVINNKTVNEKGI